MRRKQNTAAPVPADRRLAECRGIKTSLIDPTGVGKTSSIRTLDASHTLFIDVELTITGTSDGHANWRPVTHESKAAATAVAGAAKHSSEPATKIARPA